VTITSSSNFLTLVLGSPSDNNPLATNTASFYSSASGTGLLASDLYCVRGSRAVDLGDAGHGVRRPLRRLVSILKSAQIV
jgi:hypothetical protein